MAELWVAQLGTFPTRTACGCRRRSASAARRASSRTCCSCSSTRPCTRRAGAPSAADLPMGEDWYRAQGIEVCDTDRGGRVTYHGPGQLVAYPIMAVERVADFVHTMEGAIVSALADEGIAAEARETPFTGVWAGDAKIASIGVRLSRRRDHPRARRERGQRPSALRVDRALRHRPRADDVRLAGDRPRRLAALLPQADGVALRGGVRACASGSCRAGRLLEREAWPHEHALARQPGRRAACSTWARCCPFRRPQAGLVQAPRTGRRRATASCAG